MKLLGARIGSSSSTRSSSSPPNNNNKKLNKHRSRLIDWRPRTTEEIARKKNRRLVGQHLKRIGKAAGRELSLDPNDGMCCFSFKKFILVVEVPEENSDVCLLYAKVCHMGRRDNREEVENFLDLYNHRQQSSVELQDASTSTDGYSERTCPCTDPSMPQQGLRLWLKEEDVNLCLTIPIPGLSFQDTADHLEHFIKTAVAANKKLQRLKKTPLPPPRHVSYADEDSFEVEAPCGRSRLWSVDSQTSVSNMSQCSLFNLFRSTSSLMGAAAPPSGSLHFVEPFEGKPINYY